MKPGAILVGVVIVLLCRSVLLARSPAEDPPTSRNAPTALGITILSNPALRFSSASDYANGVSVDNNTLQLSVSLGLTWSLQVKALDNLRYQTQSIPVSAIGVQAISLGTRPEIFLSTTNQVLAAGVATSVLNAVMLIRYRAVGGTNFLKPAGTYTTTLLFSYSAL